MLGEAWRTNVRSPGSAQLPHASGRITAVGSAPPAPWPSLVIAAPCSWRDDQLVAGGWTAGAAGAAGELARSVRVRLRSMCET
jgi:hypothetical protein